MIPTITGEIIVGKGYGIIKALKMSKSIYKVDDGFQVGNKLVFSTGNAQHEFLFRTRAP
jgi:hypothetical protein